MIMLNDIEQVWSVVGKFAGALALVVAVIQGLKYLNSLTPTTKLQARVEKIEQHQNNDLERLNQIDREIEAINKKLGDNETHLRDLNEGIQRIGKSQIALLRHNIDGNGIEKMKTEAAELTEWFIDR